MTDAVHAKMRLLTELRIVTQFLGHSHARSAGEEAELRNIGDKLRGMLSRIEAE